MRAGAIAAAVMVLAAWSAPAWAQAPASPSPVKVSPAEAERFGRIYAEAINTDPGVDVFLSHDDEEAPEAAIREFFAAQRWITGGGVDFVGARPRAGATGIVEVAIRSRVYGAVQGVVLTVSATPEPKITYFDLTPAPAWAVKIPAPVSQAELAARIERLVDRGCAAGLYSGAVLVAAGDKVLVQRACGEASRRYHVANRTSTRFNLGSMDKMFTAVAVMQLAEAGKLSLDDTLDRHLDAAWIDPAVAAKVTIRQLLTHTAGLTPDVVSLAEQQSWSRFRTLQDYQPLTRQAALSFTPGTKFDYSNTGFVLLGAVIAEASGQDYYDYVGERVLAPAGMTATGAFLLDDPVEDLAMGYRRAPASAYGWRENTTRNFVRGLPAGGGYSTVGDLHRFALALEGGKLVSPASRDRLWKDELGHDYGAGFELGRGAVGRTVGHSGIYGGVSTRMRIYPDLGYAVVALANMDRAAPAMVDAIEGELLAAPARDVGGR